MEYNKIMFDAMRSISERRVICSGIKPNHVGFEYLADCVAVKAMFPDLTLTDVYARVGELRGVSRTTVADGIYYALHHSARFRENLEKKEHISLLDCDVYAGFVISRFAVETKCEYFDADRSSDLQPIPRP